MGGAAGRERRFSFVDEVNCEDSARKGGVLRLCRAPFDRRSGLAEPGRGRPREAALGRRRKGALWRPNMMRRRYALTHHAASLGGGRARPVLVERARRRHGELQIDRLSLLVVWKRRVV
jgi:hypothetical protein